DTGDNAGSINDIVVQMGYHRGKSTEPFTYYLSGNLRSASTDFVDEIQKVDSSPDFYFVNAPGLSSKFYLEDKFPTDD
ncbi:hypothetical protein, partial [Kordia jejudonensis]|uniref:hypothetical protein n=1 Tax=Kordia jejudonensis TaxID=1348245 RepID=UPI000629A1F6